MKKQEEIEVEIVEDKQVVLKEIKYPVNILDIDNLLKEYSNIPTINPDIENQDLVGEQYQFVLKGHKSFVKMRNQIEKTRKDLKAPALEYGKRVDNIAKEFQAKIKGVEDKLFIQRKIVEDNEERKQREAEEKEELRIDNIKRSLTRLKQAPMECINKNSTVIQNVFDLLEVPNPDIYEEFFDEAMTIYDASSEQIKQMFNNQVLVENAQKLQDEADARARELKEIEDAKIQAEKNELAKQQAEFQKQKDDFERLQRQQQEEINRQNAEREADELMRKQEAERLQRQQQEEINRQNAEREADELMRKQEAERLQRQQQDAEQREIKIAETLKAMDKYSDNGLLLNEIIAGAVPHLRWEF